MQNKRLLSGIIGIPLVYLIVWYLPKGYFAILLAAAAGFGMYEFYRLAEQRGMKPLTPLGIGLGVLMVIDVFRPLIPGLGFGYLIAPILIVIMTARLFSARPVEGAVEDIAVTLLGVIYVAVLFGYQAGIRMLKDGKEWLVFLYVVIWAADTAAYYIGTAYGRHRLYEKISPKKSVEGLGAAVGGGVLAALLCTLLFMPKIRPMEAAALGAMLSLTGVLGDLAESLIKRSVGVKDSGDLIPGHGGILDRMDSMLFAAPALFYYIAAR